MVLAVDLENISRLHCQMISQHASSSASACKLGPGRVRIYRRPISSAQCASVLATVAIEDLSQALQKDYACIQHLEEKGVSFQLLEIIQDWLDLAPCDHPFRKGAISLLCKLSASSRQFPPQRYIVGVQLSQECERKYSGGHANVYMANYLGSVVAVKQLHRECSSHDISGDITRFCREALIWCQLDHDFVLPFIGVTEHIFGARGSSLCMVLPWMGKGTLRDYVTSNDYRPLRDFYRLAWETAQGLTYLHSEGITHGDVTDCNVLVNVEGHVQISDFGQAIVVGNMTATSTGAGTKYFMSPERFAQEQRMPSDDVFAFAGVAYVLITAQRPFQAENHWLLPARVIKGQRPDRPSIAHFPLPNCVWTIMSQCWSSPDCRPPIADVAAVFNALRLMPKVDVNLSLSDIVRTTDLSTGPSMSFKAKESADFITRGAGTSAIAITSGSLPVSSTYRPFGRGSHTSIRVMHMGVQIQPPPTPQTSLGTRSQPLRRGLIKSIRSGLRRILPGHARSISSSDPERAAV